ncbi:EGF-like domain protein [Necator americanus]|uniref:EGF-like domain protein n=1 Tax=Necator americanus TaxID=51031 RepID=W2TBC5_NECAM|nr:EGF-like domain protein [Necator americanus]ETN78501.1 EGF-like domain protein [Necator americanus]
MNVCDVNFVSDDCADSPCALNATCVDLVNDYECQCPKGFKGKRCNVKEDLCSAAPCVHGLCVDTLFSRRCICDEGWSGETCEVNVDDCATRPCRNGGTCTDEVDFYWISSCTDHIPPLLSFLLQEKYRKILFCFRVIKYLTAVVRSVGFLLLVQIWVSPITAHARSDLREPTVNSTKMNVSLDDAARWELSPAKMASMRLAAYANRVIAVNSVKYELISCEQETGSCDVRPCRNDGRCVNLVADYFCVCPEGVSGKDCEIAPNRCLGEPCLNGGVCGDFGSRQECSCPKKFSGAGCQYLQDVCAGNVCQNGGTCMKNPDGSLHCACEPGFTGAHCETNIDDCARSPCPLGSTCIDQINAVYCRCPFNMTGSNCDKAIDEDYDLHFYDSLRVASASLAVPFRIAAKAITISAWVKFERTQGRGTVLRMYNSKQANYSSDLTEALRIDSEGVNIALFPNERSLQLHFPSNQRINDGAWNHLALTWSSERGAYSLIWNSVRIFAESGYGAGHGVDINALITLGGSEIGTNSFVGSITRVHVWNRVLDFDSEIPMMVVSCHGAELAYDGLVLRFTGYTDMQGKVERLPRSTCGREKRKPREEAVVRVESCPSDQYIVTPQREVNITWPEPVFHSDSPLERVERNFKQGQIFTWGEYDVLYVAWDNASNTAECNFKIHVSREHCPSLEEPVNGVQACESWGPHLRYKACSIECREGHEFSRLPAIFYTCAADGLWRPRNRNQMVFRYPQCTKSVPATRVILLRVSYPGTSPCSEASRDALRTRLLASIQAINQKWGLCTLTDPTGCVGARVDVDCSEDFARVKRHAHSFQVRIELPVKRDLVSHSISGQKSKVADALQNEIINQGAFNLEKVLPNGRPDLTSFQLLDEFHCQLGQVIVDDLCVPCAPGSYHSVTTSQCEVCAEGEYQPFTGRTECFKCPEGHVTAGEGAINENECKPNCPAGNYFDMGSSQCTPCGFGFFQPRMGSFECIPCDVGKTTTTEIGTSEEECRDECPGLFLDIDFRTVNSFLRRDPVSRARPVLTVQEVNTNSACSALLGLPQSPLALPEEKNATLLNAKLGSSLSKKRKWRLIMDNHAQLIEFIRKTSLLRKHCQFCPRGTFQDEEQRTTCKLCPSDHTTASQGATAESQCYSTNQCATGEDNCSWHAHCIDLPDDNDVPSFQCKCKPGYRGNGTYCQDACTNYCLNDGVCKKNPVGYVECACKENFSGERCEVRFQPKSQRVAIITAGIGGIVAVLVVIVIVIFMISFRFNRSVLDVADKVQIDDMQQSNFLYGRPPAEPPRPIGYYYEDDDEYESKTMYVSREDDSKEIEQRRRIAEQHMYRPGHTE